MPKKSVWTEIKNKYKIYSTRKYHQIQEYYTVPEKFEEAVNKDPYFIFINTLNKTFKAADEMALEMFPEKRSSAERCKWCCWHILKENESDGDTCINANVLAKIIKEKYPEVYSFIVDTVKKEYMFYYNEKNKMVAFKETYEAEKRIADAIKSRINNPIKTNMNWEKYIAVDGLDLTDEQATILKMASEQSIMMLKGGAGCVDCDTEFFTGRGWKRIADYQQGDKVLQYNENGTAELVNPIIFIKKPCSTLWHFETKYGINQTVCDEHRIIYWSEKGVKHECNIKNIIDKQVGNGWSGRFETAFTYGGNGINLTDEEIRVMCAVICDGSFSKTVQNSNRCRFHLKKDRKKERILELCKKANIDIITHESTAEGYTDYYIYAPIKTKVFDEYWYDCNNHQLKIICDEIIFWDGNTNETKNKIIRKRYSSNVKENAEFVQFAFSSCGYRANISEKDRIGQIYFTYGKEYTRKSKEYNVTITNRHMVGICCDNRDSHKKTKIEKIASKDGYKYCFTVPSHMLVLRRKNCIFITGNCGKTSAMKALVKMLTDSGENVTCVAPTGIAAKRLKESTKHEASTIHRFLTSNKQVGDFLIIDEASILGVRLLAKLLERVPNDSTKIIFVCDEAQLCSIACGNLVQDIIDSGIVPTVNLTRVFRYGKGGIATVATDVRMGKPISSDISFNDYSFVQASNHPLNDILSVYDGLRQQYHPSDIMILSPFNVRETGTYAINKAIQDKYNPNPVLTSYKRQATEIEFKIGDKCINTENNYHMMGVYDDIAIMNGEQGVVTGFDGELMTVDYECGTAMLEKADIWKQLLGYSISVHKSQGTQAKAVIVVADKSHGFFLTRNLIYVALSRAQEKLVLVGDIDTINEALKIEENKERETFLKELLLDKSY